MSLDSESSPSSTRDWFFPPQSFLHSYPPKSPTYIRRFSETSRISRRYADHQRYRKSSSCISDSHSCSSTSNDAKFARTRRRIDFDRRSDLSLKRSESEFSSKRKLEQSDVSSSAKKVSDTSRLFRSFDSTLKVRWRFLATAASIFIVIFATLLHENSSLQEQVNGLEARISNLNIKLRACNLFESGSEDDVRSPDELADFMDKRLKTLALIASLTLLLAPIIILKYIDSKSRSLEHNLEEVSLNKQLLYKVDVFFSVHPYAKPLALLIATLLLIMLGGLALFGVTDDSLVDCLWLSWTYVADSGNHANSEGIGPRLVSVSVSFGGMLIFAMMLGLVSDSISERFDSLRKGRSEVVEQNHTLILGWSDKLGSLLNQISIANESLGGGTVVVMAERDKEEMELDIAKMEFDFKGTSVICRSGSPLILADLKKVSVSKARAIVVIAEDGNADQSDARALRTVLSLTGVKEGLRGHIVVELSDLDNELLVKLVGGELVETVVAHDVIGRLMIQCARQPGLAQIWEDILGFENCEFYIKRWPQLNGMQFEDVLISFPDAIPCGIKVASRGGKIVLNPEDSYVLQEGDEVLVIAEDDDTYAPAALPTVGETSFIHIARPTRKPQKILLCGWRRDIDDMIVVSAFIKALILSFWHWMLQVWRGSLPKDFIVPKSAERILLCGWRRDMEDMIMVLDAFLAPGSELWMFNDVPENEREKKLVDGGLDISRLENISLVDREGNAVIRRHLESLPLESFDSILILADESVEDSAIQADSRSLATLLLIRDIQTKRMPVRGAKTVAYRGSVSQGSWIGEMQQASDKSVIISEILDPRTKNLLSMSKISDYVLSNELVSMALAMVAEDRQINDVLEELFAEEGNELHIRQADLYLREGEELSFYEVLLRARQRREIVIGYRSAHAERAVINPPAKHERRKWYLGDVFVVIAEKE
ncbi:ion channel CASTOR-like isoform X1 [Cucurbita pepo subsp. pepo]|uniref:ion channel CASTOR-like isoform X1 n=1 Tax=Cucurbita pepo subsp. pepo TaxID=3664 RepID=UPI000C9DA058|nr:ion channel CASTOR-like isoform X1 [Cucurbita pepo subsp. pepo]XP_023528197.1 ion channel CASTOR-like isoform X1 [Cucurbita pepo subsp. pepo]